MPDDIFQIALDHHRCGRRRQAEQGYRSVLAQQPQHADALHLLGVLAFQRGHLRPAVELINRAIAVRPQTAPFHANLAEVYRAAGRLNEAVAACHMALQLAPEYPEAHNNLGLIRMVQKQFAQAEAHFRDAIRLRPAFVLAHNNLGNALREQRRRDEALAAYREAVEHDPTSPEARNNLGQMLLEESRVDEALVHCREALRLNGKLPEAHSNLGNVLRQQGKWDEALASYQAALQLNPNLAMTYGNIGQVFQDAGKLDEAVRWYQQALAKDPDQTRFHCHLAHALAEQDHTAQAIARYQIALRIDPTCVAAHLGLGDVYHELEQLPEAIAAYREAVRLAPEQAAAHVSLGNIYDTLGDLSQAEACFREALRRRPKAAGAYAGLATHHRDQLTADELVELRRLLDEPYLRDAPRATIHYALAHIADANQEFPPAAEHMRLANAHRGADWKRRGRRYEPAEHQRFVDRMLETLDGEFFRKLGGPAEAASLGLDSDVPVFIIGLPRSGTTLTEQILASHSQAHGAGELSYARESFESLPAVTGWDTSPCECAAQLAADGAAEAQRVVREIAGRHLGRLRELHPTAQRIVDKMPDNYLYAGWLATLFPRARIIHCRRDLRDVALSCWLTNFKSIRWACDHEHIAARIEQYQRVMNHWRQCLPVPMLEIDYEETVADLESVARRLVAWVGLDWDPACLTFHQTERPVRTASVTQVRQPIYTRSAGRWRKYEHELQALFARLPHQPEARVLERMTNQEGTMAQPAMGEGPVEFGGRDNVASTFASASG